MRSHLPSRHFRLRGTSQDPAIADKEVVLIVEAQLILEHYMNMRQHTHLYYKVVREGVYTVAGSFQCPAAPPTASSLTRSDPKSQ